jgi:hypothetical protein
MPSYAVLMYGTRAYREFEGETRRRFWEAYRALLADADDRLADPISYSCGATTPRTQRSWALTSCVPWYQRVAIRRRTSGKTGAKERTLWPT